jgi:hypothetical protein
MLIRFVYLDRNALEQYVSAIEGGRITETSKRLAAAREGEVGADLKLLAGKGRRSSEDEESRTLEDTDSARFGRLLAAAAADPEGLGWVDVLDPDTELPDAGIGAMISWECDLFVPDVIRMLSRAGGAVQAITAMRGLLPAATALGLDTSGIPEEAQLGAMAGFLERMESRTVVVGEDDDTDWKVAGRVTDDLSLDDLEGRARLVGKITKVIPSGRQVPFATFPGMNLMPRERRRQLEREPPQPGKESEYLHGPALMVEILAIYR